MTLQEDRKKLAFRAGDTVKVMQKVVEKGKTRLQAFEGLVIARKHGTEAGATFTVRRVASGVGVERIFPLYSPMIDKIEIVRRAHARRAKLYYVSQKAAREVRKKLKSYIQKDVDLPVADAEVEEPTETAEVTV